MLEKEQLHNLRRHISENIDEFNDLIGDKNFKNTFGNILGEQNKRIDTDFQPALEKQPLIANKSFYYFFKQSPETLAKEGLVDELVTKYKVALPLNNFLMEGIQGL